MVCKLEGFRGSSMIFIEVQGFSANSKIFGESRGFSANSRIYQDCQGIVPQTRSQKFEDFLPRILQDSAEFSRISQIVCEICSFSLKKSFKCFQIPRTRRNVLRMENTCSPLPRPAHRDDICELEVFREIWRNLDGFLK